MVYDGLQFEKWWSAVFRQICRGYWSSGWANNYLASAAGWIIICSATWLITINPAAMWVKQIRSTQQPG